ncbi:MAG: hypothetical protein R2857_14435 [Vampirovibrionales bacterium]
MTWFNPNNPNRPRRSLDRRNHPAWTGRTYPEAEALEWFNAPPWPRAAPRPVEPFIRLWGNSRHSFGEQYPDVWQSRRYRI